VKNAFVKIRTGIEEHLVRGRIGFFELGVYITLHLQADYQTGIWIGSAPRLLATAPRGTDLRSVQRAVQRLVDVEFVRTFHIPGARGNYRVLIHKYSPAFGALKGMRLNALQSVCWQSPIYEPVAEVDADRDVEDAPLQEVRVKTKTRNSTFSQDPSMAVVTTEVKKNGWVNRDEERKRGTAAALNRAFPEPEGMAGSPGGDISKKQHA
jgi:hypothetical protein